MKIVYALRHASTEGYNFKTPDHERKLTPEGEQEATQLGDLLAQENIDIQKIVSSDALRAKTTAELIASKIDYNTSDIILKEKLYQCAEKALLKQVIATDENFSSLLLVNHNPTISSFVRLMSGQDYGYLSPCSLVKLSISVDSWSEVCWNMAQVDYIRHSQNDFALSI